MSDSVGGFQLIPGIIRIDWDGTPVPLEPAQRRVIVTMLEQGFIYASEIGRGKSPAVQMSKIREIFHDMGIPYTIRCPQSTRRTCIREHDIRTTYQLVKLG